MENTATSQIELLLISQWFYNTLDTYPTRFEAFQNASSPKDKIIRWPSSLNEDCHLFARLIFSKLKNVRDEN